MKFKNGTKVVCKRRSLVGSATEMGPSLTPKMKDWAREERVLIVMEQGSPRNPTRVRLSDSDAYYGFWFECEDLIRHGTFSLENK